MNMYSLPAQAHQGTQTAKQPAPKSVCKPLLLVDQDGKNRYCYHGGKCRCESCAKRRQQHLNKLEAQLEHFVPHSRLQLAIPIRLAKPKQYKLLATRISPEMAKMLLEDHKRLRQKYPIYYLPDKYFKKNAWKYRGPQNKSTQTEIPLSKFGNDVCFCHNKAQCLDKQNLG